MNQIVKRHGWSEEAEKQEPSLEYDLEDVYSLIYKARIMHQIEDLFKEIGKYLPFDFEDK